jgi:hypothetical protein
VQGVRRECEQLLQEAQIAKMRGEYDRAQRRSDSAKALLGRHDLR